MSALVVPVEADDHVAGPARAGVTLVEYGDYECPHCGAAHGVVDALQRHFRKTLRFVYRHFPLAEIHPHARHAAEAAEAAGAQGQFWAMHDLLFTHQQALSDADLARYAATAGAEPAAVRQALVEHTYAERVAADFRGGILSGVNGTPTFFINGLRYDGGYDEASLRETIAAAM